MKGVGMLVGNFEKPLKETNLGVGQPFLTPERDHFAKRDHFVTMVFCWSLKLVIYVIESFDYMNWVNKTNWLNWRFAQNTLSETKIRNLHP